MKYRSRAACNSVLRSRNSDLNALSTRPFLRYHRGLRDKVQSARYLCRSKTTTTYLSGQKNIPIASGTAGIKAEPNCRRHDILPVSFTARFAHVPRNIPKTVQTNQELARPPRIEVGLFSAQKTEVMDPFKPMPIPSKRRATRSWTQVWENAEPMGGRQQNIAATNIAPRRPK